MPLDTKPTNNEEIELHQAFAYVDALKMGVDAMARAMDDLIFAKSLDAAWLATVNFTNATFGEGHERDLGKANHLLEEAGELQKEIEENGLTEKALEEAADVFFLLGHLIQDRRLFAKAIFAKLDKNRKRKWGKIDADGKIKHEKGIHD